MDTNRNVKRLKENDKRVLDQYNRVYLEYSLVKTEFTHKKVESSNLSEYLDNSDKQPLSNDFYLR